MQITKMAWRNVWRNTRRSCVTIGAMTFSLLMMILATSFYEGFLKKWKPTSSRWKSVISRFIRATTGISLRSTTPSLIQ
jgi:hypothetical protein